MDAYPINKGIKKKRYIDLFAGLGGFHVGLAKLGHECVFASELDEGLRNTYRANFGIEPKGDIRIVNEKSVPNHDVLCAGFPCQPFSRAGKKKGSACPESGDLINDVFRIVREKRPAYVMLENVPDILTIDEGRFWEKIVGGLEHLGYKVDHRIYTPQDFGIPQKRRRVFVVAGKNGLDHFCWPEPTGLAPSLSKIIEKSPKNYRSISNEKRFALEKWNEFISKTKAFTSLPILAHEFGATYPYNRRLPTVHEFRKFKGAFGRAMGECKTWSQIDELLPNYAKGTRGKINLRTIEAIEYSRDLYKKHRSFIDRWISDIKDLPSSWLKFEWQGHRDGPNIWEHLIQFRSSGIRIIKPESAPSLVAMTTTQVPIIGSERRYMTIREAAALQSLDHLDQLPTAASRAYKALGNAVNADIVRRIAERLLGD